METIYKTVSQLIETPEISPIPLEVFPNQMGINLCSVEAISWQRQLDGQLTSLTVYFLPEYRKPAIEIDRMDGYLDGGTIAIYTKNNEHYCIDGRVGSKTKGEVFLGYPDKGNVVVDEKIKNDLKIALKIYTPVGENYNWVKQAALLILN